MGMSSHAAVNRRTVYHDLPTLPYFPLILTRNSSSFHLLLLSNCCFHCSPHIPPPLLTPYLPLSRWVPSTFPPPPIHSSPCPLSNPKSSPPPPLIRRYKQVLLKSPSNHWITPPPTPLTLTPTVRETLGQLVAAVSQSERVKSERRVEDVVHGVWYVCTF